MRMRTRKAATAGLTLIEVVIAVFVLFFLTFFALLLFIGSGGEGKRIRCRNYLNQIAKGMATYLNEHGDNRWFPCPLGRGVDPDGYTGGEWLASLYWTKVIPDPGVFLCPRSSDSNSLGGDLGTHHAVAGKFGPRSVSYAGLHDYSRRDDKGDPVPGAIPADYPSDMPMVSDDTEGDVNHQGREDGAKGMSILFFDTHVEFMTPEEVDPEHAVGQTGGLLEQLRN